MNDPTSAPASPGLCSRPEYQCPRCRGTLFDIEIIRALRVDFAGGTQKIVGGSPGDDFDSESPSTCVGCENDGKLGGMHVPDAPPPTQLRLAKVPVWLYVELDPEGDAAERVTQTAVAALHHRLRAFSHDSRLYDYEVRGAPGRLVLTLEGRPYQRGDWRNAIPDSGQATPGAAVMHLGEAVVWLFVEFDPDCLADFDQAPVELVDHILLAQHKSRCPNSHLVDHRVENPARPLVLKLEGSPYQLGDWRKAAAG